MKLSLDWLLVFVPAAILLEFLAPQSHTLIFCCAAVAVIPLAGWMGKATEHIAEKSGAGIGGLLNATFGNAAELIIALLALHRGLIDVVKASLTGSIIGNVLLVFGASVLAGGLKYESQPFNRAGARVQATTLLLAAFALVLPAAYHHLAASEAALHEADLSLEIAIVLLITYGLSLLFSLRTHSTLFTSPPREEESGHKGWTLTRSLAVLGVATALIGWISEILVGSVEPAAKTLGMTEVFVGVIVVAIVGNAAEHSTAIVVARKNQMDLSIGIAFGSTVQVALFVAPVLVLASYVLAPRPMDLVFSPAEVLAVVMSAIIAGQIAGDGESNWLEGVQLLAVYLVLGLMFYFLPASSVHP